MNLEYFIAQRGAKEAKNQEPSVMMRVATVAVSLGIVVMIITLAVIGGFKSQINSKLSGLSGHVVVTNTRGVQSSLPIAHSRALGEIVGDVGAVRESAYIMRGAIARAGDVIDGVVVKGVDSHYNAPFFEEYLVEGHLPEFGSSEARREVLISSELASAMETSHGERVELLFVDDSGEVERLTFRVGGVFSIGVGEMERGVVIADIETLRKVNAWSAEEISGLEIWLDKMSDAERVAEDINKMIIFGAESELDSVVAIPIERLYPALFDWLKTHDINGVIVVAIMLIVAIFNMITALLILVLERTRMIGILKSLGMGNESLRRIFLYRALGVIVRGLVCGNIIAAVLCGVQSRWGVVKLEASGYMLSQVPIEVSAWWWIALNVGVVVVVLAVMTIPVRIVATITPDEIVKYK